MKHSLNLEDTKTAFAIKSTAALRKAKLLFTFMSYPILTRLAKPFTQFLFTIKFPISGLLKNTIFSQFCGGESIVDCTSTVNALYKNGNVFSILDYSVEGKQTEEQFDKTLNTLLKVCAFSKANDATPFIVFKGTGLGRFALFEKVSTNTTLSLDEKQEWERVEFRFDQVCNKVAETKDLKVMVDAEETWIQEAIDQLAEVMIAKYNKKRAVVFQTIQLYRWDRLAYLKKLLQQGEQIQYQVGVKLVRGAYMEKERERALSKNYKSPICKTKNEADSNFNAGVLFCLLHLDIFEVFMGTHNEISTKLLASELYVNKLENGNSKIWFGQLYGMSDHISFNLAKKGYNTAKYLPFGPIKEVIPYLIRRAEENSSVGEQTSQELQFIKNEIERRKSMLIKKSMNIWQSKEI